MKKYFIYIGMLTIGLVMGWLLFSNPSNELSNNNSIEHHSHEGGVNEIWTCSMHPQIRKNEAGDCPICGMDLIPADNGSSENELVLEMTDEAVRLSNIQTTVLMGAGHENGTVELSGKIQKNEENAASLVTQISGRIEKLYVSYTGEQVNKGQKIARIYSPILINAQKELLEADKLKVTNPALLEAAKNKLRNWKITDEQIATILSDQKVQETFVIYAQYSGVITNKKVSVGDHLKEGEVLFDIQNLNSLWVIFDAYENDLNAISIGDEITFTTTAFPAEIFKAKVDFIDPTINPSTRTISVRAELNNRNMKLKPEMFVQGTITQSNESSINQDNQVLVPKSAVLWTGQRSVVYVKLPNAEIPSFEFREIEIGQNIDDSYIVKNGLEQGDEVVTNGAFVIDAAAQLNNQSSMMNRSITNGTEQETSVAEIPDFSESTSMEFKMQLSALVEAYLEIKNALVASNSELAIDKSKELKLKLDKVDMKLVKGKAHIFWMKQHKKIKATKEGLTAPDIATQRTAFIDLSVAIESILKAFKIDDSIYYVQYCPMANSGDGAIWISAITEIKNPYFGEKMLGCGSTKEILKR